MFAYLIRNRVNEKVYVGITGKTVEERFAAHLDRLHWGYKSNLYAAMRKYGEESFYPVEVARSWDWASLQEVERALIVQYNSYHHGYNMTLGGDGISGIPMAEATKKKIRASHMGERNHFFGKTHNEQTRKRLVEASTGRFGEQGRNSRISDATRRAIAERYWQGGITMEEVAQEFGVTWRITQKAIEWAKTHGGMMPPPGFLPASQKIGDEDAIMITDTYLDGTRTRAEMAADFSVTPEALAYVMRRVLTVRLGSEALAVTTITNAIERHRAAALVEKRIQAEEMRRLQWVCGLTVSEIAARMEVSPRTVSRYLVWLDAASRTVG